MSKTNSQIVKEYIEIVCNNKQFDRVFEYCSQDCITHAAPYVGLGFNTDDRSGDRVILTEIAPNSPAAGKLQTNDEIVRVVDAENSWETFQTIKSGMWGQGVSGTSLTLTINRNGKRMEVPLKRGRVEGFNIKISSLTEIWRDYFLKYWPDLIGEIKMLIEDGDLVACYLINSGTNLEYHHSAVWDECDFFRLKDGKITEIWALENTFVLFKQLGYQIREPATTQ
jgi:hypothetical protein